MQTSNVRSVRLRWTGQDLVFRGGADGGPEVVVDGGSKAGASAAAFLAHAKGCTDGTECKQMMDQLRSKHEEL